MCIITKPNNFVNSMSHIFYFLVKLDILWQNKAALTKIHGTGQLIVKTLLNNDADQSAIAVIDDFLHSLLKL